MAQTKDEANVDVDMISDKLDNLTYTVDKNVNLLVNQFNLASGEDNVTDTSTATVSFIANEDKQLTARMILNDKVYKKITEVYQNEIVNPAVSIIHEAKIGLMYVSDYAYSAIPINWFSILYNYNSTSQLKLNWLYSSTSEWLITRNSTDTRIAIHLSITTITRNDIRNPYAIRPTFSLISSTNYKSGNGTQNDPIIIE